MARTGEPQHALIALVPTLLFLVLDTYYLALGRAFRSSYDSFVGALHNGKLASSRVFRVTATSIGLGLVGRTLGSVSIWLFYPLVAHTPVGYPAYRRIVLTANQVPRHKVFIRYYDEDNQEYKDRLVQALASKSIDKSVSPGDIHDQSLPLDEIRRRILDDHIAGATVTIVLIGPCAWQRKHVDWEISARIIDRRNNQRCGLMGLLLPLPSRLPEKTGRPQPSFDSAQVGAQYRGG